MNVNNPKVALLSNHEVMSHLQKLKDQKLSQSGQLATITYETLKYLEFSGCTSQHSENIAKCVQAINKFQLTKSEKLMIVNNPPTTPLEIQLIVEKSEERLSDNEVAELLQVVASYLLPPPEIKREVT